MERPVGNLLIKRLFHEKNIPRNRQPLIELFSEFLTGPTSLASDWKCLINSFSFLASFKCLNVALASTTLMNEFHE